MNFPRYWAQANLQGFRCWRWSDTSLSEAQAQAAAAAAMLKASFNTNWPPRLYGYAERPLREPVLREIRDSAGGLAAVISRNAYGCQILNTASAMFVDVDLPEDKPKKKGIFGSLFSPNTTEPADPLEAVIAKAENWARRHDGWNWRAYRTKAGLRLLATHRLFAPAQNECLAVFNAMGADPLYQRLCGTQECFRARLTPKPWRCGVSAPPCEWPFQNPAAESRYRDWESAYRAACQGNATCQFLKSLGSGYTHEAIHPLVALHDEATLAASGLPLA
jgi:hypothetical protein